MDNSAIDCDFLREQTVGVDSGFDTAFGRRLMVYCDYTASGRCLRFVEKYIQNLQRNYANTHTEDDLTGRSMSELLHRAETIIKTSVNAGPGGRIIACGTGATGAIDKLQQILGIALAPATRESLFSSLEQFFGRRRASEFQACLAAQQPVVFVGPYEHHSNEISWRHGVATVVEVDLDAQGGIDLGHLESLLRAEQYQGRMRIGSFSAASNVTGMRTAVHEIACLLHEHNAYACFDYAASAPYVDIDMNPSGESNRDCSLDAVFISPHKFLGGPGSSGILVFNERLYNAELPPSVAAGGTVDYVSPKDQDFIEDIEQREKAGTPGVLQTMKAAMAFEVKNAITSERIEKRESELLRRAFERWGNNPDIEILGNPDPAKRIGIVSFNIRDRSGRHLHPKFVTVLLNDLFGIQSRAGCSCAGPYGHRLLDIDLERSAKYRNAVQAGYQGIKPGWCRIGFHYCMDDPDADYVIDAVDFLGRSGYRFLPLYRFDMRTGCWIHRDEPEIAHELSLAAALESAEHEPTALPRAERTRLYKGFLDQAAARARELEAHAPQTQLDLGGELGELQFFSLCPACTPPENTK